MIIILISENNKIQGNVFNKIIQIPLYVNMKGPFVYMLITHVFKYHLEIKSVSLNLIKTVFVSNLILNLLEDSKLLIFVYK